MKPPIAITDGVDYDKSIQNDLFSVMNFLLVAYRDFAQLVQFKPFLPSASYCFVMSNSLGPDPEESRL